MNEDPFHPIWIVGALLVSLSNGLSMYFLHTTFPFLPLTIIGGALITWRIVAGWTTGWCGAHIRHDLRTGNVVGYLAVLIASIALFGLFFHGAQTVDASEAQSSGYYLNDLGILALTAFLCTFGAVAAFYSLCLAWYRTYRYMPPEPHR